MFNAWLFHDDPLGPSSTISSRYTGNLAEFKAPHVESSCGCISWLVWILVSSGINRISHACDMSLTRSSLDKFPKLIVHDWDFRTTAV